MTRIGAWMAGGGKGRAAHPDHWYRTEPPATVALLRTWWPASPHVHEAAAGDGAMAEVLSAEGLQVTSSDLRDRGYAASRADTDFFALQAAWAPCLITNPPYKFATRWIWHAFGIGYQQMALLLPINFWCAAGRLPLWEAHRPSLLAPLTWRLDPEGLGRPVMSFMWVIWDSQCANHEPTTRPLPHPHKLRGAVA